MAAREGCKCHAYCEAVLEFTAPRNTVRDCEAALCSGRAEYDYDGVHRVPNVAQHASWDAERQTANVLCGECMQGEVQRLPDMWQWQAERQVER